MTTWRPLSVRNSGHASSFDTLHEGVPPWLSASVLRWLYERMSVWSHGQRELNVERVFEAERALRVPIDLRASDLEDAFTKLLNRVDMLDLVDLALHRWAQGDKRAAQQLEQILLDAGSAWMVHHDATFCLVRRVEPEVYAAASKLISEAGRPGALLGIAWQHAYGRSPNPGLAYREAVRAIEAAACPVVLPKEPMATLGKVIIALRQAPPGKFAIAITPDTVKPAEVVANMMALIWKGQIDRHGTADESVPLTVSQKEAEMAVHLAVPLVHWFTAHLITNTAP